MDKKEWKKISRIFTRVLTLPYEARATTIKRLCENDPELEKEIHDLMDSLDHSGKFLEKHRHNKNVLFNELENTEPEEDFFTGENVGRWTLQQLLGRGGMGSVYKAETTDEAGIRQTGALKIIHKSLVIPSHLERFRLEQQILARLRHPNVAVFIDSGITDDGIPYMVMEYVEGEPILDYCNKRCLSIDQRLELFKTVCRTVQYAHKNLIVHRDLKSENILVTEEGHLKILDFGIAKLLDHSNFEMADIQTQPGSRIMSLDYAAPEQVLGDAITTSTDIYSLGILLFKLLTDIYPFDFEDQSFKAAERIILEKDPPSPGQILTWCSDPDLLQQIAESRAIRPSDLQKKLKGDLDAITIKALRKKPEDRYESAEALENDLDRHQKGLPINARPDSVSYRAKKFIRRHRSGVITAAVMTLVFISFAIFFTFRITTERNRAEEQRAHAEAAFTFLTDMLKAADPDQTGGEDVTARDLLEEGTDRAMQELQNDPVLRATVLHTIGDVYGALGDHDRADSLLSEALKLRQVGVEPDLPETGQTLLALGRIHQKQARYEIADSLYQLAEHAFATEKYAPERAQVIRQRATVASQQGNAQLADSLLQQTVEIRRRVLSSDHPDWAESLNDLSYNHIVEGNYSAADSLLRIVLDIKRQHYGDIHSDIASTYNNLAFVAMRRGDLATADSLFTETIRVKHRLYDGPHPSLAVTLLNRGAVLSRLERYEDAEKILREALEQQQTLLGNTHPETATTMFYLGTALRQQERFEEAETYLLESYQERKNHFGPTHDAVAKSLFHLGELYLDQKRSNEAERVFRDALSIWQNTLDKDDPQIASVFHRLANLYRDRGRLDEACSLYQKALPIYEAGSGVDNEPVLAVRRSLEDCEN